MNARKLMKKLSIRLRAVFYMQEDRWVAHCLEFNLCGDGDTQREALESMSEAVACQVENAVENGNPDDLFSPADGKFFRMFASGKYVAVGKLEIHVPENENIVIEGIEAREYSDDDLACAP
jgi:predicted RNase H-like HicB family nuclease